MNSRAEILRAVWAAQPDPLPHPGVPGGSPGRVRTGPDAGTGGDQASAPGRHQASPPDRDQAPATRGDMEVAFARALEEAGGQVLEAASGKPLVELEPDAGGARVGRGDGPGGGTSGGPGADPDPAGALRADRVAAFLAERFPDARIASTVPGVAGDVDLAAVADPHDLADLGVLVCRAALGVAENGAVWLPESAMGHRAAPFLAQHMLLVLARDAIVADLHAAYQAIDVDASGFGLFVAGPSKTADIEQSLVMGAHGPRSLTLLLSDGDV